MSQNCYYDPCSFSNPANYLITHASFDWNVDFDSKTIKGICDLTFNKNSTESADSSIILDTRDLKIHNVVDNNSNKNLEFIFGEPHSEYGKSLKIALPNHNEKSYSIKINYETSPNSTALQWLDPMQTIGKKKPYLFSQCQAIHARSLFPCQDTPAVKFTYEASVTVNKSLVALMSALRKDSPVDKLNDLIQFKFYQPKCIPSYLVAIVVGDLSSKQIGPRSHVWTESSLVEASAYEFAETEEMIKTGESLCGDYVWQIYDLLILPPTFPYGGMENPCLTFVTPALLAGDRSLADVVVHEISHSWTGNLVTNRNWEHFWLNEGFTMFVERKIISRMRGEQSRQFDCIEGWRHLVDAVQTFGENHEFTKLVPNLTDKNPDDSFSSIPYEKGFMLLYHLEEKLGGIEVFDKYLMAHVKKFDSKSFDTNDWKAFLYEYFNDKKDILDSIDWNGWLYSPGIPPFKPNFDTTLADQCTKLAKEILESSNDITTANPLFETFSSHQKMELISQLFDNEQTLTTPKIESLDRVYNFGSSKNAEILFKWLRLGIKSKWEAIIKPALEFVSKQGRMKYCRPIYRDLFKWDKAKELAIDNFKQQRKYMHQTTATLVAKDLGIN